MTIRMNPAHDTKNPPGQVREVDANGVTKGFDRYPFLKTSTHADPWPYKAPISPAKRLGDIIDGVVARSSERPSNRTESAPRHARVVISMKNVKPLSQATHQRLKAAARDPANERSPRACDECEGTGVAPPSDYDQGYKDGWDAAILQVVKKELSEF